MSNGITTLTPTASHDSTSDSTPQAKTILIFSQVYPPDAASVGQYISDVAQELSRRGHRVIVLTSDRGYDDPSLRYPSRETLSGVDVRRIPFSSFGKKSFFLRVLATCLFTLQAALQGLRIPHVDCILSSTSPPLCGLAALALRLLRRKPYVHWMMDLNPDQLIALGDLKASAFTTRLFEGMTRSILKSASVVVALDRFMADRLLRKGLKEQNLRVIPPWPHEDHLESIEHSQNPFREQYHLQGKFVFMYSGNHSSSNPLDTLLEAARHFATDPQMIFMFVGGGLAKGRVEDYAQKHGLRNVLCLPYQPLEEIRYSLSSADVHLVSMGEGFVGIIHPCKIYGAMACGRPILYLGPERSHISEIMESSHIGWRVAHGDVEGAIRVIEEARSLPEEELVRMGAEGKRLLRAEMRQDVLCGRFCDYLEELVSARAVSEAVESRKSGVG